MKIRTKDVLILIRQEGHCKQKLSNQILLFSLQDTDATFTSHLLSIALWHPRNRFIPPWTTRITGHLLNLQNYNQFQ